jgi:hypothetical protein
MNQLLKNDFFIDIIKPIGERYLSEFGNSYFNSEKNYIKLKLHTKGYFFFLLYIGFFSFIINIYYLNFIVFFFSHEFACLVLQK